jgi:hypothetical protein
MDEPRFASEKFRFHLHRDIIGLILQYNASNSQAAKALIDFAARISPESLPSPAPELQAKEPATPTPEDTSQCDAFWGEPSGFDPILQQIPFEEVPDSEPAATADQSTSAAAYIAELEVKCRKLEEQSRTMDKQYHTLWMMNADRDRTIVELREQCRAKDRDLQDLQRLHALNTEGWQEENARSTAELEAKCRDLEQERGARIDETDELYSKLEKAEAKVKELEAKHESMINALRGGIGLRERLTERIAYLTAQQQVARSGLPAVPPKRFPWLPNPFRI